MKIWQKDDSTTHQKIEVFTVGRDREMDELLAKYDVLGNMAHGIMLYEVGFLTKTEINDLLDGLRNIAQEIQNGAFKISDQVEDIHSEIEWRLTQSLGDIGKKIHTGRSRNDQVLVDLKLYFRAELEQIVAKIQSLFDVLQAQSETHKDKLLPGYTHFQIAMPSSFGLWFGAYAESLADDLHQVLAAFKMANKNPLGSGAGYGSSFPLHRQRTTDLLGFDSLNYNVVYAQMTRGKTELAVANALATVAATISKYAMDVCLYNSQNFGFIHLPKEMTTGSSIMPHKKNPDVAELLRAKTNKIKALPNELNLILGNLPSGYHRDLQILKETVFPAIYDLKECLDMAIFMTENLEPADQLLADTKYDLLFSVENVNELVKSGLTFREAYIAIGQSVENKSFKPHRELNHTLEGGMHRLMNASIKAEFDKTVQEFNFEKNHAAIEQLIQQKIL